VGIVLPLSYPDTESSYRGQEGVRRWFQQMDEIWDDWRLEAERFFDVGSRVVVFVRVSGRAKQSDAPIHQEVGITYRIRAGKLWRMCSYSDPSEALEAVGLRE